MSTTALKFCVEALSLPRETRAEIAERLIASLEDKKSTDRAEKAWKTEIRRRRREIREGKTRLLPANEAMDKSRLARECAKLNRRSEQGMADEGLATRSKGAGPTTEMKIAASPQH